VERQGRLGALVFADRLLAEPVAAAAGREVVERQTEAVSAEEPLERCLGSRAVLGIAGAAESGELGLDERRCVERLLVAGSPLVRP
jgi:hypothetical protein